MARGRRRASAAGRRLGGGGGRRPLPSSARTSWAASSRRRRRILRRGGVSATSSTPRAIQRCNISPRPPRRCVVGGLPVLVGAERVRKEPTSKGRGAPSSLGDAQMARSAVERISSARTIGACRSACASSARGTREAARKPPPPPNHTRWRVVARRIDVAPDARAGAKCKGRRAPRRRARGPRARRLRSCSGVPGRAAAPAADGRPPARGGADGGVPFVTRRRCAYQIIEEDFVIEVRMKLHPDSFDCGIRRRSRGAAVQRRTGKQSRRPLPRPEAIQTSHRRAASLRSQRAAQCLSPPLHKYEDQPWRFLKG